MRGQAKHEKSSIVSRCCATHGRTSRTRSRNQLKINDAYSHNQKSPRTFNHKTDVDLSSIEHHCSCEDTQPPTGTFLPHQIELVLVAIVDLEFGRGAGSLGDHLVLADASSVREEFFLEVLGDPSFDDDVVGVLLEGVSKSLESEVF